MIRIISMLRNFRRRLRAHYGRRFVARLCLRSRRIYSRSDENRTLYQPFAPPTPAAIHRHLDALWQQGSGPPPLPPFHVLNEPLPDYAYSRFRASVIDRCPVTDC